jgi:hypothetical protein
MYRLAVSAWKKVKEALTTVKTYRPIDMSARDRGKETIENLFFKKDEVYGIHYACSNINTETSPSIACIVIRSLTNTQTLTFSIWNEASKEQQDNMRSLSKEEYEKLEKPMLKKFFEHLHNNQMAKYVHWNMRDEKYGFAALEKRAKSLGLKVTTILDKRRLYDLASLLTEIYGEEYTGHPRMETLFKKNKLIMPSFMSGEDEAKAISNKEYKKVADSTSKKVDGIITIIKYIKNNTLKTDMKFWQLFYSFLVSVMRIKLLIKSFFPFLKKGIFQYFGIK